MKHIVWKYQWREEGWSEKEVTTYYIKYIINDVYVKHFLNTWRLLKMTSLPLRIILSENKIIERNIKAWLKEKSIIETNSYQIEHNEGLSQ